VSFVDSLEGMQPPFEIIGPAVEGCTTVFPERVNAEFVEVRGEVLPTAALVWDGISGRCAPAAAILALEY
jgi:hypothetical protein